MSEKMEKRIKIGIALFFVFIALFTCITLMQHSKYDDTAHKMEQGKLPVYVTPPNEGPEYDNTPQSGGNNATGQAPVVEEINRSDYKQTAYKSILEHASKADGTKVSFRGTIYSSVAAANGNIYSIADGDGNYYSVIDKTGKFERFNTTKIITCYGKTTGTAKLNTQDIPQITIDDIEEG